MNNYYSDETVNIYTFLSESVDKVIAENIEYCKVYVEGIIFEIKLEDKKIIKIARLSEPSQKKFSFTVKEYNMIKVDKWYFLLTKSRNDASSDTEHYILMIHCPGYRKAYLLLHEEALRK